MTLEGAIQGCWTATHFSTAKGKMPKFNPRAQDGLDLEERTAAHQACKFKMQHHDIVVKNVKNVVL